LELSRDLYELQNNQPMSGEQEDFLSQLMEKIWEGQS
jgi:exonuclease SbcD